MSDIEYSVITSDVIKSFDCISVFVKVLKVLVNNREITLCIPKHDKSR